MTDLSFDPAFAAAIRKALVTKVQESGRPLLRRPFWISGLALVAVITAGAGTATAGLLLQPGAAQVISLGQAVEGQGAGTGAVELGTAPAGATNIAIEAWCLTAGTFVFGDGASFTCTAEQIGQGVALSLPLDASQHSVSIVADLAAEWRVSGAYVNSTTTPWSLNRSGNSYGVINDSGTPDLVAVETTAGQLGYVYAQQLADANGTSAATDFNSPEDALEWQQSTAGQQTVVPAYSSDGISRVGDFIVQH